MRYVLMIHSSRGPVHRPDEAIWQIDLQPAWMSVVVDPDYVDGTGADDSVRSLCLVDCRDIDDVVALARRVSPWGVVDIRPAVPEPG